MNRRDVALILAVLNIVAATILELCGINPRDQVLLGMIFGITAVLVNNEAEVNVYIGGKSEEVGE